MPIPRIPQYPNPPGSPTLYPERAENDLILGLLVSPGYFFVTLVLLIGLALGDTSAYGVNHFLIIDGEVFIRTLSYLTYLDPFPDTYLFSTFQICLFNTFGFLLHVSAGTVEIVAAREAEANGATVSFTKTKKTFQIIHHNTKSYN